MKRAIIFLNGDLSDFRNTKKYIKKTDYIICADGAAKYVLKLGIKPDVIIGDLDSLAKNDQKKFEKNRIPFITYQKEKEQTDSELSIKHALGKKYKTILIFGILGTRLDHLMTNIFSLEYLLNKNADVIFIEGNQEIRLVKNSIKLRGKKKDLVSLIPFKEDAKKVTTKNLQYPLTNETLKFGYSRGISNVFMKDSAEISVGKGSLLVIHTKL